MTTNILSKKRESVFIFIAACLILLVINIFSFHYFQKVVIKENYEKFVNESKSLMNEIQKRLNYYEIVLTGARGLFVASKSVERDEWKKYVNGLSITDKFPGIQAVGFSLYIPKEGLSTHLEQIRLEGFTNYNIWPPGEREEYSSTIYIEPFEGRNLRAFGYDMMSESVRNQAMKSARDSNETVLSSKVRLVQETDVSVQNGFLMYLPVYKNDMPHETIEERRRNLLGFVYIPFRMDDFIWGLLRNQLSNFRLEIYDGEEINK